jgi:hypothetical protein
MHRNNIKHRIQKEKWHAWKEYKHRIVETEEKYYAQKERKTHRIKRGNTTHVHK